MDMNGSVSTSVVLWPGYSALLASHIAVRDPKFYDCLIIWCEVEMDHRDFENVGMTIIHR